MCIQLREVASAGRNYVHTAAATACQPYLGKPIKNHHIEYFRVFYEFKALRPLSKASAATSSPSLEPT